MVVSLCYFFQLKGKAIMLDIRNQATAISVLTALVALSLLGCRDNTSQGELPPKSIDKTDGDSSRASVAGSKNQGTFEVTCKPKFKDYGISIPLNDSEGNYVGDTPLVIMVLQRGKEEIYVAWKFGTREPDPVRLNENKRYTFVLKAEIFLGEQAYKAVKILDDSTVIFENQGKLPALPVGSPR